MPVSSYFIDISSLFIEHYFELLASNSQMLENMYAENCKLVNGTQKIEGKADVYKAISSLKGFTRDGNDKFIGQPYGEDDGIIVTTSAKIGTKRVHVTFILSETDKISHQYGIVFQLIYQCK